METMDEIRVVQIFVHCVENWWRTMKHCIWKLVCNSKENHTTIIHSYQVMSSDDGTMMLMTTTKLFNGYGDEQNMQWNLKFIIWLSGESFFHHYFSSTCQQKSLRILSSSFLPLIKYIFSELEQNIFIAPKTSIELQLR